MAGLNPTRTNDQNVRDHTWLASYDGLESAESATFKADTFDGAGGHRLENWVRGGTPVAKLANGEFALYNPAGADGSEKHYGFLVDSIQHTDPVTGVKNTPLTGAVLNWGQIIVNRLPVAFDKTDADVSAKFIYR
ncbi:capsid decoration protein [Rhodococcus phage Apiary]|nr:capsid decoration protein [Rhodococcus phage Braxoaddie]WNM67416.1 capsid decoration protein [Rhodococcus phage Polyyuki]WNM69840.1 capsid decoration protein [Rhodococcus phage Apiary]